MPQSDTTDGSIKEHGGIMIQKSVPKDATSYWQLPKKMEYIQRS